MIPAVRFTKDWRCFALDTMVVLKPGVNLIVGDQGSGKTSLLRQIGLWVSVRTKSFNYQDDRTGLSPTDLAINAFWHGPPGRMGFFDFEKNNPRTAPAFDMFGIDMMSHIQAMYVSHGEFVRGFLTMMSQLGQGAMVLDEPDMALSPRTIHDLARTFQKVEDDGGQIIASAHNPLLIATFPEVLSLEHGRWMPSHEFLELQATTPAPQFDPKVPRKVIIDHPSMDTILAEMKALVASKPVEAGAPKAEDPPKPVDTKPKKKPRG